MSRWLTRGPVEAISPEAFSGGRGIAVIAEPASRAAGSAAVERARSRLGEDCWRRRVERLFAARRGVRIRAQPVLQVQSPIA